MTSVIVVFPKDSDGKNIKNILVKNGFTVAGVCTSGGEALNMVSGLNGGIVVCGYHFRDMIFSDLFVKLPPLFGMIVLTTPIHFAGWERRDERLKCLALPVKLHELVEGSRTLEALLAKKRKALKHKPAVRSAEEQQLIDRCKQALMREWGMTEPETHKYIQNYCMSRRISMMEAVERLLKEHESGN